MLIEGITIGLLIATGLHIAGKWFDEEPPFKNYEKAGIKIEKTPSVENIISKNENNRIIVFFNGNPLDVTDYMIDHPGGKKALEKMAGKEISETMESLNHSQFAYEIVESLLNQNESGK